MMTVGYLFLGDNCPRIQPYLPSGNLPINDKKAFWKNCCIRIAVINALAVAVIISSFYYFTDGDLMHDDFTMGVLQKLGANITTYAMVLAVTAQFPDELMRYAAYKKIMRLSLICFTLVGVIRFLDAHRHYKDVNARPVDQRTRLQTHNSLGG